jgi:type III pantothenate kinase
MILVIDVGNTRVKWAWLDNYGLSDQQAVVHRDTRTNLWTAALFDADIAATRVLASNVAGPGMAKALTQWVKKKYRVPVEFVTPTATAYGITNGYLDPSLLGPDRWLALIGAWTRTRSAVCVVDAGTAVKVDGIDSNGQHLGGLIVPGIHMMREVLMKKTSDIANSAQHSTPSTVGILANNTIGAVARGAVFALAGMADHAAEVIEQSAGVRPKLFLTGGDAAMLTGTMRVPGEVVPDLVLQGLAVIGSQPQAH